MVKYVIFFLATLCPAFMLNAEADILKFTVLPTEYGYRLVNPANSEVIARLFIDDKKSSSLYGVKTSFSFVGEKTHHLNAELRHRPNCTKVIDLDSVINQNNKLKFVSVLKPQKMTSILFRSELYPITSGGNLTWTWFNDSTHEPIQINSLM